MNREESTILSTFMLFQLIFMFTRAEIQARELQEICSSSCGDIKDIRYPFRLKGDPKVCGDHDYELSCENNKTILEYFSLKYYVKRISYDNHIISVVEVHFDNGSCGLPPKSMSGSYSDYRIYLYTIVDISSRASFMNCSMNITGQAYRNVPCLSKNQSNVFVCYGCNFVSNLPNSCASISSVPVKLLENVENHSYEDIRKLLESGFNYSWSVECRDCRAAGGYCSNLERDNFHCYKDTLLLEFWPRVLSFILGKTTVKHIAWLTVSGSSLVFVLITTERFILGSIVLLVFLTHKYRTTLKRVDNVEKFLHNQQSWMPKRYSYPELIAMTNHFQEKLGKGGFGSVYKGQLHSGHLMAVKLLENSKFSAEEFINEVSTIGRIHHVNVVQLLGFCSEGSKRALVYEYMPNGSLDKHIFSKKGGEGLSFSWEKLHEIALGTARGIEYLHGGCDFCILHFDIKPHNILLDHNFVPKVSDFGLAKFYPKENDFVSISATRGTIGYIAPELISRNFGTVSCKSDVYSFGMLLLEMAGGRRNSNMRATRSSKAYFPSWAYEQISKGGDMELRNVTEIESLIARKLCIIGLWCIQVKAVDRPSMNKVMEMLEGNIEELQMPPKPFFSSSSQHISGREIESDSSIELLISESIEECSLSDSYV